MRYKRVAPSVATLFGFALVAAACGGGSSDAGGGGGSSEEAAACTAGQTDGDLALYNWSEYLDPALIDKFEAEAGVSVTQSFFDSNESMQPIISAGNSGFDLIVPSDYMVEILIQAGDLQPLQQEAIPNRSNLLPEFASGLPFDPDGTYVVPYQWGTTGLGVDLDVVGEDVPHTWGLVFDPALREQYGIEGKITLLNDSREVMGAALKYLGYSLNSTSADELGEAKQLLADSLSGITAFDSDQYDELLITGDSALAQGFSGNFIVQFGEADNPDQYEYFVPDEGGTRWVDNMAVVKDAPHPCTAHAFINFLLEAENGAALSNWNYYASPNAASEEFLDPDMLADPIVYPTDVSKLEFIANTGDFEISYTDAFIEARN